MMMRESKRQSERVEISSRLTSDCNLFSSVFPQPQIVVHLNDEDSHEKSHEIIHQIIDRLRSKDRRKSIAKKKLLKV